MLLEGVFLPVATPFYPDGRVYLRKLEHNVDRYSRTPAAGLYLLGPLAEAAGLTDAECAECLRSAMSVMAKEKVAVAEVGRESVFATLKLAEAAAEAGCDAVAVRGPEFAADTALERETLLYFRSVADRSALPVVVVSEGNQALSAEVLAELAAHGNILGAVVGWRGAAEMEALKAATAHISREVTVTTVFAAATGRMLRSSETPGAGTFVSAESLGGGGTAVATAPPVAAIRTRARRVGFQVLVDSTVGMLEAWGAGAVGAVPRLGAAAPQACCEVWQALKDGDAALAEIKQQRVRAAGEAMAGVRGIAAAKHGCDLNGYFGGRPRLPLVPLNAEEREALERTMAGMRN